MQLVCLEIFFYSADFNACKFIYLSVSYSIPDLNRNTNCGLSVPQNKPDDNWGRFAANNAGYF